jgi:outer membrane biosynthesis protein TonB
MSEVEKRGRGRPKGSLNLKTIAKQQAMQEATTLDVSFEEEPEPEPDVPELKKQRQPRKPKIPERVPEPETEEEPEPEAEPEPESEPEAEPEPKASKPKKKARKKDEEEAPVKEMKRRKPKATTVPRDPEPQLTYLQVLQRGLAAANATQKAERVQRYDAYFSHL